MVVECWLRPGYRLETWQTWYKSTEFKSPKVSMSSRVLLIDVKRTTSIIGRLQSLGTFHFLLTLFRIIEFNFIKVSLTLACTCLFQTIPLQKLFEDVFLGWILILKIKNLLLYQKCNPSGRYYQCGVYACYLDVDSGCEKSKWSKRSLIIECG